MKQWREFRQLTQEAAAQIFEMSPAQLSRIENAKSPYTQDFLELAADLYQTTVTNLLARRPGDADAIWTIWDQAKPGERSLIEDMARTIVRRRS